MIKNEEIISRLKKLKEQVVIMRLNSRVNTLEEHLKNCDKLIAELEVLIKEI